MWCQTLVGEPGISIACAVLRAFCGFDCVYGLRCVVRSRMRGAVLEFALISKQSMIFLYYQAIYFLLEMDPSVVK